MTLIRDRVDKAKMIEAEIQRLSTMQSKRTRVIGESSESLEKEL